MLPIILVMAGGIMMWIGMTDSILTVLNKGEGFKFAPGYPNIPFLPYALAAVVVTSPLVLIKDSEQWAGKYILLILIMAIATNYEGIKKFADDFPNLGK